MKIIRIIGSLPAAIFLITVLMLTLTVSTITESFHGTPFVQSHFYNTRWFDTLLALFGLNIFCSTLTRWPFQKKHIGFVITHIGILLFLSGSLVSRAWGVEGQMTLFEGQKKSWMLREGLLLQFWEKDKPPRSISLKKNMMKNPFRVPLSDEGTKLFISQVRQDIQSKKTWVEGGANEAPNRAIELSLSSDIAGLKERFRLAQKDPDDPHSFFKDIGPAHVELRTTSASNAFIPSTLFLAEKTSGKKFVVEITEKMPAEIPLENSRLKITALRYYPNAHIENRKIVNSPESVAFNPAVEFELRDDKGRSETHTKFFLFPQFESLKGGPASSVFGLDVSLNSKVPENLRETNSPGLFFFCSPEGQWSYQIRSSKKSSGMTPLKLGEKIPTGWMDIAFVAHETFLRAKTVMKIEKGSKDPENVSVELTQIHRDGKEEKHWVFIDKPVTLDTAKGPVKISLEPASVPLSFSLALKDFRKIDYPGTQNPSSYESDIVMHDDAENLTIEKTIKMNKPLDYKGWRIFQASYIQDPESGEASVFSIAKNPGIPLIYLGAATILLGVIFLFYFHPFFSREE